MTFAYNLNSVCTSKHLMSVNGKFVDISREDLYAVGEQFQVPGYRATGLIQSVLSGVSSAPQEEQVSARREVAPHCVQTISK